METENYYKILGISEGATSNVIKKAHRKLAIKFHPDKNKGYKNAEKHFKILQNAYEILSDSNKREKLDEYLKREREPQQQTKTNYSSPVVNSSSPNWMGRAVLALAVLILIVIAFLMGRDKKEPVSE